MNSYILQNIKTEPADDEMEFNLHPNEISVKVRWFLFYFFYLFIFLMNVV